ncbi:MAG TPA: MOSC domain-containing protein [Dehalococcoidia bacterium]
MEQAVLLAIQVGTPRQMGRDGAEDPMDRPWSSAIFKESVAGPVRLGRTNLEGDRQADGKNHGGPDKAVLLYAAAHYPAWREELGLPSFPYGAFGENFTVAGLTEETVCIGDVYAVGQAVVQVSQPRQPCWKLAYRWRIKDLTARVERTGRTGWYARVLREGRVQAGDALTLLERPHPGWTVARATAVMRRRREEPETALALGSLPALAEAWRSVLTAAGEPEAG